MSKIGWKTGNVFSFFFVFRTHDYGEFILQTSDIINVVNLWNAKELYFHSSFRNLSFSLPSCTYLARPALKYTPPPATLVFFVNFGNPTLGCYRTIFHFPLRFCRNICIEMMFIYIYIYIKPPEWDRSEGIYI